MDRTDFRQVLVNIQTEYLELPGLRLTLWQATRLWNLPMEVCETAMGVLALAGFLVKRRDGAYLRRGSLPPRVVALDALTWTVIPHDVTR